MSTRTYSSRTAPRAYAPSIPATRANTPSAVVRYVAAAIRLSLGWVFLWAFLDKLFGLGHDTTSAQAWIHGGSPTLGFLKFGAKGPFAGFYHTVAGAPWADWLFMIALAAVGIALIAGVVMRIAAASGALMLVLMYTVVLPPANNPFMDDHLLYALTLILLAAIGAGAYVGLGGLWQRVAIVRRFPILK